jgi:pantoate--beta-alanine ligase
VREPDGLAMSSRNAHLSSEERRRAAALHRALLVAEQAVAEGARDPAAVSAQALNELSSAAIEPEYLALVTPDTLEPVQRIEGEVLALVAARVGNTRLIDNHRLSTPSMAGSQTNNGRP